MADITDGNDNDVAQHSPAATAAAAGVITKPKKPKSEAWHAARKNRANIQFLQHIESLKSYKEIHGHCNVTIEENPALHRLCVGLRDARRKVDQGTWKTKGITVDNDRIALLDAIGFDWNYGITTTKKGLFDQLSTATTKGISIYWSSSEAAKLFGFPVGTDVYHSLQDRIDSLEEATLSVNGYKQLLLSNNNNNNEEQQPMTEFQIFKFRHQCLFLRTAYQVAIEKMGIIHNNFKMACCEAMTKLNSLGFDTATSANTIMEWNKDFRTNNGKFSHPNNKISSSSSSKMKSGHNKDDNKNNDDTTNTLPENNNNEEGLIAETEEAQDGVNKKRKAKNINLWSINERERMRMKMKANTTYPPPNIG
jgi:hypothetical protein